MNWNGIIKRITVTSGVCMYVLWPLPKAATNCSNMLGFSQIFSPSRGLNISSERLNPVQLFSINRGMGFLEQKVKITIKYTASNLKSCQFFSVL